MVLLLLLGLVGAATTAGVTAAQEAVQEDGWEFTLSPYFWGTGLYGSSTIGDTSSDIDADFSDIWDALEMAAMLDFRAEQGRWAIQTNLVWADLESDGEAGPIRVKVKPTLWIAELGSHYRVTDNWELLAGMRYYNLDVDVNATVGSLTLSRDGDENWVDPIVGTVFKYPLTDRLSVGVRGDIGGFDAGSDLSWQLWGLFDYRFGEKNSVVLGWRHLRWDYDTGSGDDRFGIDTYMTGPILGVRFRF
jgi:hypothetical protein